MSTARFRKKPVIVSAIQWTGGPYEVLNEFCGLHWGRADARGVIWGPPDDKERVVLWNKAEQQWLCCPVGWWIVRGVEGEYYPVKLSIFEETYEPVIPSPLNENGDG